MWLFGSESPNGYLIPCKFSKPCSKSVVSVQMQHRVGRRGTKGVHLVMYQRLV